MNYFLGLSITITTKNNIVIKENVSNIAYHIIRMYIMIYKYSKEFHHRAIAFVNTALQ